MRKVVVILISYRPGDPRMLEICLDAVYRHTKVDFEVVVAVDGTGAEFDAWGLVRPRMRLSFHEVEGRGSERHGAMLDEAVGRLQDEDAYEYLLTLDSDCFPVKDGWLERLLMMASPVSGIVHPFQPPDEAYGRNTFEYRVMSRWCYRNTHVACQVTPLQYTRKHKLSYQDEDDTGLAIPMFANEKRTIPMVGMVNCNIRGYLPTMCPAPDDNFDPELNRDVCVVFGDSVCHVGGGSRDKESMIWPAQHFQKARERVREEGHARWIFEDPDSHDYQFDKEFAVVQAKMRVMRALMVEHLKHNDSLFKK